MVGTHEPGRGIWRDFVSEGDDDAAGVARRTRRRELAGAKVAGDPPLFSAGREPGGGAHQLNASSASSDLYLDGDKSEATSEGPPAYQRGRRAAPRRTRCGSFSPAAHGGNTDSSAAAGGGDPSVARSVGEMVTHANTIADAEASACVAKWLLASMHLAKFQAARRVFRQWKRLAESYQVSRRYALSSAVRKWQRAAAVQAHKRYRAASVRSPDAVNETLHTATGGQSGLFDGQEVGASPSNQYRDAVHDTLHTATGRQFSRAGFKRTPVREAFDAATLDSLEGGASPSNQYLHTATSHHFTRAGFKRTPVPEAFDGATGGQTLDFLEFGDPRSHQHPAAAHDAVHTAAGRSSLLDSLKVSDSRVTARHDVPQPGAAAHPPLFAEEPPRCRSVLLVRRAEHGTPSPAPPAFRHGPPGRPVPAASLSPRSGSGSGGRPVHEFGDGSPVVELVRGRAVSLVPGEIPTPPALRHGPPASPPPRSGGSAGRPGHEFDDGSPVVELVRERAVSLVPKSDGAADAAAGVRESGEGFGPGRSGSAGAGGGGRAGAQGLGGATGSWDEVAFTAVRTVSHSNNGIVGRVQEHVAATEERGSWEAAVCPAHHHLQGVRDTSDEARTRYDGSPRGLREAQGVVTMHNAADRSWEEASYAALRTITGYSGQQTRIRDGRVETGVAVVSPPGASNTWRDKTDGNVATGGSTAIAESDWSAGGGVLVSNPERKRNMVRAFEHAGPSPDRQKWRHAFAARSPAPEAQPAFSPPPDSSPLPRYSSSTAHPSAASTPTAKQLSPNLGSFVTPPRHLDVHTKAVSVSVSPSDSYFGQTPTWDKGVKTPRALTTGTSSTPSGTFVVRATAAQRGSEPSAVHYEQSDNEDSLLYDSHRSPMPRGERPAPTRGEAPCITAAMRDSYNIAACGAFTAVMEAKVAHRCLLMWKAKAAHRRRRHEMLEV
eukprot:gene10844-16685_t